MGVPLPTIGNITIVTVSCQTIAINGINPPPSFIILQVNSGGGSVTGAQPAVPTSTCSVAYGLLQNGNQCQIAFQGALNIQNITGGSSAVNAIGSATIVINPPSGNPVTGNTTPITLYTLTTDQINYYFNNGTAFTFGMSSNNVQQYFLQPLTTSTGWTCSFNFLNAAGQISTTYTTAAFSVIGTSSNVTSATLAETGTRWLTHQGQLQTQLSITPVLSYYPQTYAIFLGQCPNGSTNATNWIFQDIPTCPSSGTAFIETHQGSGILVPNSSQYWQVYIVPGFNTGTTGNYTTAQIQALYGTGQYSNIISMAGCGECSTTDAASASFNTYSTGSSYAIIAGDNTE
jgi:hypothetical protein